MVLIKRSIEALGKLAELQLTKSQREGVFDVFLAVTYVDGAIDKAETDFVNTVLERCSWEDDTELGQYILERRNDIMDLIQDEGKTEVFLRAARVKLGHPELLNEVCNLCEGIAASNAVLTPAESKLIEKMLQEFR